MRKRSLIDAGRASPWPFCFRAGLSGGVNLVTEPARSDGIQDPTARVGQIKTRCDAVKAWMRAL